MKQKQIALQVNNIKSYITIIIVFLVFGCSNKKTTSITGVQISQYSIEYQETDSVSIIRKDFFKYDSNLILRIDLVFDIDNQNLNLYELENNQIKGIELYIDSTLIGSLEKDYSSYKLDNKEYYISGNKITSYLNFQSYTEYFNTLVSNEYGYFLSNLSSFIIIINELDTENSNNIKLSILMEDGSKYIDTLVKGASSQYEKR